MTTPQVRFAPARSSIISTLEVSSPSRHSVLLQLGPLLFDSRVQVLRTRTRVHDSGVVEQLHLVDFDGGPLAPWRKGEILERVRQAVGAGARAEHPAVALAS